MYIGWHGLLLTLYIHTQGSLSGIPYRRVLKWTNDAFSVILVLLPSPCVIVSRLSTQCDRVGTLNPLLVLL